MSDYELRNAVFECLNNAVDNGFQMNTWSVEEILDDLLTFSSVEDEAEEDLRPHIERWLISKNGT